jgi:hypothetical protein
MLTKLFAARDSTRPLDRPTAWACLTANLLVLPGLGSIAGRRRVGWLQAILAAVGFGSTLFFMLRLLQSMWHWAAAIDEAGDGQALLAASRGRVALALGGLGLFALAWVWGLVTGLSLVRESAKAPHGPPEVPPRI